MRTAIITMVLCLMPLWMKAQIKVEEQIEGYNHTLTFTIDGKLSLEESYILIDGELVPHGMWKMYDSEGRHVYRIEYYDKGILIRRFESSLKEY